MKTKPIGVRFEQDMLDELKELGIANSPQKALNWLTQFYKAKDKGWIIKFTKEQYQSYLNKEKPTKNSTAIEIKEEVSRDATKAAIEQLEKEIREVPKSYSETGKIIWVKERNKKIQELKNLL